MDIATFKNVAGKLPAEIAILMRGPTGVGKSFMGRHVADELELPFIDVRLSTMSEGDMGGYPDIEGMKETGIMTMCMPGWFMRACKEPVVLMLDEMNRALMGVQQSAFQLVLDRELGNDANGNPYALHPETRIIAAVNCGAEYTVEEMDPALLRRFWVVDLEPTSEDWIVWATDEGVDEVVIDFIRQHPEHLRVDPAGAEPGKVLPNPASWHRLNDSLAHAGLLEDPSGPGFYAICSGFVGAEAAIRFTDFAKNFDRVVSAEDVIDRWDENEAKVKALTNDRLQGLIQKVSNHCKDNAWTATQAKNVAQFAEALPGEMMVSLWNSISATQHLKNIQKLHKLIGGKIVEAVNSGRNVS
jgi:hypothetical protein